MSETPVYDLLVIGGGINGCGIARDAAGRGYSVCLAEMDDLASGTSSGSTKLIHGGLRYLEHYEFRLVREALKEREVLWKQAPHIIWPLRFILPHHRGLRPAWLLRFGLFLYDHIGGRRLLPATRTLDMRQDPAAKPLKPLFSRAFEFSDCWVDDARLVVLNARDAANRGADIRTRTRVSKASREGGHWLVELSDSISGSVTRLHVRLIVNAAGPWIDHVLADVFDSSDAQNVRLVQGSHIVIKKKFKGQKAYFFQNTDGRVFFAIPYEDDFTLIGTTDHDYEDRPENAKITAAETEYLCEAASEYFLEPVRRDDIVWTYSGVRPLIDDGASRAQEATRDYVLKVDSGEGHASVINIFGGKITTYRRLAESVMEKVESLIGPKGRRWTANAALPGGDFAADRFADELAALQKNHPFLETAHARRLMRRYGKLSRVLLGSAASAEDLGRHFGADLYQAEIDYLIEHEWARTGEDVLWRRTKRGLQLDASQIAAVNDYVADALSPPPGRTAT